MAAADGGARPAQPLMVATFSRITTLLVAAAILLIGHGLQLTLLPTYAAAAGWTTSAIGFTGSSYFLGFVVGCIVIPRVVLNVGHIRTFMVMGAVATIALLGAALFVSLPTWLLFRFATGFALSGLYVVIESWLNDASPAQQRGTVLAIYTLISLLGMASGQLLMFLESPLEPDLFLLGAILLCIAIVPIGLTRVISPEAPPSIRFAVGTMLRASPVAVVATMFAGSVTGAFWSLGPVLAQGFGVAEVGTLMSVGILGGAVAQLPAGRLSDRMDRRIVIGGLLAGGTVIAGAGWLLVPESRLYLLGTIFLLSAATMPIYALCIAHASETSELSLVQVASGTLLMHSAGSIVGPAVVAGLMDVYGVRSYFAYVAACLLPAAIWTFYRRFAVERPREFGTHAVMLPRTTQVVAEMPPQAPGADRRAPDAGAAA